MAAGFHQSHHWMIVGRFEARQVRRRAGSVRENAPSGGIREACFAHALGSGEQPGMMQLARGPGARELLDGSILANNHGSSSPIASSSRAVTSAGLPEASMSFTRSGSSAAMMR